MTNREINWEEVEIKVGVICSKFRNIRADYIEDLAQELRIHAFHKSDDYYDLYRRAIDFFRQMQSKVNPELPYFDMEVFEEEGVSSESTVGFEDIIYQVKKELSNEGYLKKEQELIEVVNMILDLLTEEIVTGRSNKKYKESNVLSYFGGKLSVTWISERTEVPYKKVQDSIALLQETIKGLALLGRIDISDKYL